MCVFCHAEVTLTYLCYMIDSEMYPQAHDLSICPPSQGDVRPRWQKWVTRGGPLTVRFQPWALVSTSMAWSA